MREHQLQQSNLGMFYADESGQESPKVQGMGPLVSAGGIYVPGNGAAKLHQQLEYICTKYGCPVGDEFKWNARRDSWMHGLMSRRSDFHREILQACIDSGVKANVVIVEKGNYSQDSVNLPKAFQMLMERVQFSAQEFNEVCGFVSDRRSHATKHNDEFVGGLLDTIHDGTEFVLPQSVIWATSSDSRNIKEIQAADLIVGCTTQFIAGRFKRSEEQIGNIYQLIRKDSHGQINGYGLKLWPNKLYDQVRPLTGNPTAPKARVHNVRTTRAVHRNPFVAVGNLVR